MQELRIARAKAGMTLMELEAASGVGASTISKIERGVTQPQAGTLLKLADALGVEVGELYPKDQAPLLDEPEEERRLRYLRGWRAFIHRLARRWEEEPPKTSAEISPLFDSMTALVEQGVFEPSEASASEGHELMLLTIGFERLNDIADKVEKDEEAEERRATLRLIQEKRSA